MSQKSFYYMNNQQNIQETDLDNPIDINYSKPTKSRFKFVLGFFVFLIFALAGCYKLYTHHYPKNDNVKVEDNTLYEPKYK